MKTSPKTFTKGLAAAGIMACTPLAHAVDMESIGEMFSANVALTSDYVWRGVSQSDESGAIQGGIDLNIPIGLYAGIWGSNVNFDDPKGKTATVEFDYYGGYSHTFDMGLGFDVGLINYTYPRTNGLNWVEYYLKLSYGIGGFNVGGSVNYSNNVFDTDEDGTYWEANAGYTLGEEAGIANGLSFSGGVGYYDIDKADPDSYTDWNLGATMPVFGFDIDLRYYDTDDDGEDLFGTLAGDRYVASISKSF
jgi:uncharacterized protein (TIGR02001 family)